MKQTEFSESFLLKSLYGITAVAIGIYLILRAVFIPLVHDEAATFFYYIHSFDFVPFIAHWDANNHVLNSALASFFFWLFGPEEWVLRLPNLLAFPFYAWYIFKLGYFIQTPWIRNSFRFVLLLSHGILEFFALCRGYGISMAAMAGGLYFLMQFQQSSRVKHLIASLIAWNLAVLANLNLSASYLLSLAWVFLLIVFFTKTRRGLKLLVWLSGVFCMAFFAVLALELKKRGLLYYGAADGFWEITVQTLIRMLFGFTHPLISGIVILFTTFIFLSLIYFLITHRINQWFITHHIVWPVFFTANLAAIFLQNKLMHVNFPEDRTGMHLYVLLAGSVLFLADWWKPRFNYATVVVIPMLLIPLHLITYLNIHFSTQWKQEHIEERLFHTMLEDTKSVNDLPLVGGYVIQHLIWYYYVYRHGGNAPLLSFADYPAFHYDYVLMNKEHRTLTGLKKYTLLDEDPYSGIGLYKRNQPVIRLLDTCWTVENSHDLSTEFMDFFNATTQRYMGDSLAIEVKFNITSKAQPFIAYMVVSVDFPEGGTRDYQYANLQWMRDAYTPEQKNFHQIIYIPKMPEQPCRLAIYLWNFKKVKFTITDVKVIIYRIREANYTSISSMVGQ
jgi:hypothetical protein